MTERQLRARVDDALLRPSLSRTGHEDHARPVPRADEAVVCLSGTVDEVPRSERPLLALDQQQAFAGEDEEFLLVGLTVISPTRLLRLEHRQREADVRERRIVALEDAGGSESRVRHPRGVPHVDDEPALAHRCEAGIQLLKARFLDHAAPLAPRSADYAAAATSWSPRSVVDVASSIRTWTSSPGAAAPAKLTVVLRRVRPRRTAGSVRLGPSTSTSSTRPTRSRLRAAATRWTEAIRRSIRSRLTSSGTWSGMVAASVP